MFWIVILLEGSLLLKSKFFGSLAYAFIENLDIIVLFHDSTNFYKVSRPICWKTNTSALYSHLSVWLLGMYFWVERFTFLSPHLCSRRAVSVLKSVFCRFALVATCGLLLASRNTFLVRRGIILGLLLDPSLLIPLFLDCVELYLLLILWAVAAGICISLVMAFVAHAILLNSHNVWPEVLHLFICFWPWPDCSFFNQLPSIYNPQKFSENQHGLHLLPHIIETSGTPWVSCTVNNCLDRYWGMWRWFGTGVKIKH